MIRRKLAPVIAAAMLGMTAGAAWAGPADDTGGLLAYRDEITGVMNYCFKNVKQDQLYIQARDIWTIRNQADLKVITDAIQKLGGIGADEQKQIDDVINQRIEEDVTSRADHEAFCNSLAGDMKDGTTRDMANVELTTQLLKNVRDFLSAP